MVIVEQDHILDSLDRLEPQAPLIRHMHALAAGSFPLDAVLGATARHMQETRDGDHHWSRRESIDFLHAKEAIQRAQRESAIVACNYPGNTPDGAWNHQSP